MKTSFLLPALFSFLSVCVNSRPEYERHKLAKRQSIKAASPFDHSWVGTLTAIGDSYSAGLGAGHAVKAGNNVSNGVYIYNAYAETACLDDSSRSTRTATNTATATPIC